MKINNRRSTRKRSTPLRTRVRSAERRQRIAALYLDGYSCRSIGSIIGIDGSAVYRHLVKSIEQADEATSRTIADIRKRSDLNLDLAERLAVEAMDTRKDRIKAASLLVRVDESRRKLYGADAPMEHAILDAGSFGDLVESKYREGKDREQSKLH